MVTPISVVGLLYRVGVLRFNDQAGPRRRVAGDCHDHLDLLGDQVGRQRGQPIKAAFRPAVFDRYVFSPDIDALARLVVSFARIVPQGLV
jgi:hypothetical protein